MRFNKPTERIVFGVVEEMSSWKQGTEVYYLLVESRVGATERTSEKYTSKNVFSTKEELIASLS